MGSFAATCCVSGLPIEAGDEVRFLLLQSNRFSERGDYAKIPDSWFVRTPPLRAKYNDYGSVEDVEDGPLRDVWVEMFDLDLVEKGVGDNTCHDVAARKRMSFPQLLEALQEQRVKVRMPPNPTRSRLGHVSAAKGIPTIRRVERAIAGMGAKTGHGQYLVDRLRRGEIRVRMGRDSDAVKPLEKLADVLAPRFAVMVRCGSGSYGWSPELIVAPKPGAKEGRHTVMLRNKERSPHMVIRQAMVREDVWQALIVGVIDWDFGKNPRTVDTYRAMARETWKRFEPISADLPEDVKHLTEVMRWVSHRDDPLIQDPSLGAVGIGHALDLFAKRSHTEEQRDRLLDSIGEVAFITHRRSIARAKWHPAPGLGPQCGEWDKHVDVLRALLSVAEARKAEQDAERAKWAAEDESAGASSQA